MISSAIKSWISCFPAGITYAFAYGSAIVPAPRKKRPSPIQPVEPIEAIPIEEDDEHHDYAADPMVQWANHVEDSVEEPIDEPDEPDDVEDNPDAENRVLEIILVVDDPTTWHTSNLAIHPDHYTCLGYAGANIVHAIQKILKSEMYSVEVTMVEECGKVRTIKYGVVSTSYLIDDLTKWSKLHVAALLQQPVIEIIRPDPLQSPMAKPLMDALEKNRRSVLFVALALLPMEFTELELFKTLTHLSLDGDFYTNIYYDEKSKDQLIEYLVNRHMQNLRFMYFSRMIEIATETHSVFLASHLEPGHYTFIKAPHFLKATMNHHQTLPWVVSYYIQKHNPQPIELPPMAQLPEVRLQRCETLYSAECKADIKKSMSSIMLSSTSAISIKEFIIGNSVVKMIDNCGHKVVNAVYSLAALAYYKLL